MAADTDTATLTLRGSFPDPTQLKAGTSSGILLRLSENVLQDITKASKTPDALRFTAGSTPKLRIGSRTIDLSISHEEFRTQLFASTALASSATDFTFTSVLSHRARVKPAERTSSTDTSGTDAALAALQSSLASYEQEKQANQVNITNALLPTPKSRFDAARKEKLDRKHIRSAPNATSVPVSPSLSAVGTPKLGSAPTSAPMNEESTKLQAMKTPILHLLAMGPLSTEGIVKKTHVPKDDLENVLQKIGKQVDGKWQPTDRAYRELDVWKFAYPSESGRQAAIENAVKAYDRMRLGKDEQLWQMLLPREERGKGTVLSKLHLGAHKGLTPHHLPSPLPHVDGGSESKAASAANTPRQGASTPRPVSSKGDVMKRLFSKDPKKARATEEAKEKKRKEREAAASDKEGGKPAKKQATSKANSNFKSAEFVFSSDDESDDEIEVKRSSEKKVSESQQHPVKDRSKAVKSSSSDSSDTPLKVKKEAAGATKANGTSANGASAVKVSDRAKTGSHSTPQKAPANGLSAPNSQHKNQRSPQLSKTQPTVPSPLGAARPRVASDVSERGGVGVQRIRQGGESPKGLGITAAIPRKRHDTITSVDSTGSNKSEKRVVEYSPSEEHPKANINGDEDSMARKRKGTAQKTESAKRKAVDSPTQDMAKHRKIDDGTVKPDSKVNTPANGAAPTPTENGPSDDSGNDTYVKTLTFVQGLKLAEKFRDVYYPAYTKLYDEQEAVEARGEKVSKEERARLWQMHKRLESMKKEINLAAEREHAESENPAAKAAV